MVVVNTEGELVYEDYSEVLPDHPDNVEDVGDSAPEDR